MGGSSSVQTVSNNINQTITNSLVQSAEASASATCEVIIGSINIFKSNGCTIHVENMCSASASSQVEAIKSATIEVFNSMTATQQNDAAKAFTASANVQKVTNNITQDFSNYIEQTCLAKAVLENTIKITDININECNAPPGQIMVFKFINSGSASGQCAMKAVSDSLVTASNQATISEVKSQDNLWIYFLIIGGVIALFLFTYYLKLIFVIPPEDRIRLELAKNKNKNMHWSMYYWLTPFENINHLPNNPKVIYTDRNELIKDAYKEVKNQINKLS